MLFMFLLTANLVKTSHILTGKFFIFIKNVLKQTLNSFNTNLSEKSEKQLPSKANFRTSWSLDFPNFRLK